MKANIAIIEDDKDISSILANILNENDYSYKQAYDGSQAMKLLKNESFDLVLMDLMLPYVNGETLIYELRKISDTPVIVISAKSMMETKLEVLRLGADDYIIKPFDINEVIVRIEVVLRRMQTIKEKDFLESGGLKLILTENRAEFEGTPVQLTAKEMSLLELFMKNPKKTYTKAELYETVWNDVYYYEDNTINVHVSNLRNKLKKVSGKDHIETVWGIGYRLRSE
ncbi:MAG: response regulator transcription factor [Ruminococcus sp.]|nr:response regulator transcription factor [Ruminococcus sp.]